MSRDNFVLVLTQMYDEQKDCDIKFQCPDANEASGQATIGAHKSILSIASDVFHTMFYGSMTQTSEASTNNVIEIPDIKISTIKMLLSFIYGKTTKFSSVEVASEFYYAADKYNCKDALKLVSTHMLKELNVKNCIYIYEATYLYNNQVLNNACLKMFTEATDEILKSDDFLSADVTTLKVIYSLQILATLSEMDLVRALERYIEHNKANDPDVVVKVRPVLNLIQFLTLKWNEIVQTSLLTSDEIVNILTCLASPTNLTKMPKGFSTCTKMRVFIAVGMIRALSDVYSSKSCYCCIRNNKPSTNHAMWNCKAFQIPNREVLGNIFSKYNHTSLQEYNKSDVKLLFEIYRSMGFIETTTV